MNAKARYYAAHKEAILARMKERYLERKEEKAEELRQHPELIERDAGRKRRSKARTDVKRRLTVIDEWLKNPSLTAVSKAFIEERLLKDGRYKLLKPSSFMALGTILL